MVNETSSQKPFIIGLLVLGALMIVGIGWAVVWSRQAPASSGKYDANVSFLDENDPSDGKQDSSVVVHLFEDFECSACRVGYEAVKYAKETYGDRVKFVWNDYPLESLHPQARLAANAGRCAEEQGKFWEFAEKLYEQQPVWSRTEDASGLFGEYAQTLGMNRLAFSTCLGERRYDQKIIADMQEGEANRVDATPTFFIGKDRFVGAIGQEEWDTELRSRVKDVAVPAAAPAPSSNDIKLDF